MKKYFLFFTLFFLFLISSCKTSSCEYTVVLRIIESSDCIFISSYNNPHFQTSRNVTINCEYHLLPYDCDTSIGDVEVYSTDPDVIEIVSIDTDNYKITARTKNEGVAKIRIVTNDFSSCTSLCINVI